MCDKHLLIVLILCSFSGVVCERLLQCRMHKAHTQSMRIESSVTQRCLSNDWVRGQFCIGTYSVHTTVSQVSCYCKCFPVNGYVLSKVFILECFAILHSSELIQRHGTDSQPYSFSIWASKTVWCVTGCQWLLTNNARKHNW